MAMHYGVVRPEGSIVYIGDFWDDMSGQIHRFEDGVAWVPERLGVYRRFKGAILPDRPRSRFGVAEREFGDILLDKEVAFVYSDRGLWEPNREPRRIPPESGVASNVSSLPGDWTDTDGKSIRVLNYQGVWQTGLFPWDFYHHRLDRILNSGIALPNIEE